MLNLQKPKAHPFPSTKPSSSGPRWRRTREISNLACCNIDAAVPNVPYMPHMGEFSDVNLDGSDVYVCGRRLRCRSVWGKYGSTSPGSAIRTISECQQLEDLPLDSDWVTGTNGIGPVRSDGSTGIETMASSRFTA